LTQCKYARKPARHPTSCIARPNAATRSLGRRVNAEFTRFRDLAADNKGYGMSMRRACRAIARGAAARPGAGLILGHLLLIRP
jgi:hypothetical protein